MPLQLIGSIGRFALIGGDRRVVDIALEPMRAFFQAVAVKKTDIVANELGIYSFLPVGRYGKATMSTMSVPKHLLQSRKNCKTWTPKGQLWLKPDEIDTFPVEYMGEQCSDSLMGNCLEYVLGTGNEVRDIFATPEGQALFEQAITNILLGLGNSFFDLATFGLDPTIADSDTNLWWNTGATTTDEWADYLDQQNGIGVKGHITLIEEVKAAGDANFTVDIPLADVSGDQYTGADVTGLFDDVKAAASSKLRIAMKQRGRFGAVMLVSRGIFDAYKDYIVGNFTSIPEPYRMFINGEVTPGVLSYDGIPVVCMDEWTEHDELLGINTHRVVLTVPGNLVVAHDVEPIDQFGGIGMRVEQSPVLKDKGIVYMNTTFRLGTAIADTDFMVNASRILTP